MRQPLTPALISAGLINLTPIGLADESPALPTINIPSLLESIEEASPAEDISVDEFIKLLKEQGINLESIESVGDASCGSRCG